MEKIASFQVDHTKLMPGLYISRFDEINSFKFTTFDLRMIRPNSKPVMDTASIHTIEHLGATFFRNKYKETMYFGPMGCRTGFYLIVYSNVTVEEIRSIVIDCMKFIIGFSGEVIGATPYECGNYMDMDLKKAQYYARRYLKVLETK